MAYRLIPMLLMFMAGCVATAPIKSTPPEKPDPKTKYLFWMHGIGPESKSPDHKRVQHYEKIAQSLANHGYTVISEHRDDVVIEIYAKTIADQARELLNKGVPPKNITIAGFSKGSLMAAAAATDLANPKVNFVLVSGCTDRYDLDYSKIKGRILSIVDKGDEGWFSCAKRIIANDPDVTFKEVEILMGRGHRGFRIPKSKFMNQWQPHLFDWIH